MAETFPLLGARVRLRPFSEADISETYVGWLNDPQVVRYSNQRFAKHTVESSQRYLAGFAGTANLFLAIERLDSGAVIGTMTAYVWVPHGTVDLGIMVGDRTAWGGGFGQDAWSTLVEWFATQPQMRKITAGTLACNYAMIQLAKKAGMMHEATRERQEIVDGRPQDIHYYARFTVR